MRWIVIAAVILVSSILCLSNWQPITLYFLGNSSQTALFSLSLPLAIWVLLFTLAGLITGFMAQILNRLGFSASSPRRPRQRATSSSSQPSDFSDQSERNWEQKRPNEWDIEDPPKTKTQPRYSPPNPPKNTDPPIQDRFQADSPPNPPSDVKPTDQTTPSAKTETSPPPKEATREGSVYTYTYRQKGDRPSPPTANSSDPVYDANYRVITPPQSDSSPSSYPEDDEEDWI